MSDRYFSDNVQYKAVLLNLEKNSGQLKCALCQKNITSKAECHFDHIVPFAKGGKSVLENCQILCVECNLSKSDKQMQEFLLEEKAKRFMSGETINAENVEAAESPTVERNEISKEKFDAAVKAFIEQNGNIRRVDFTKEKNGLPSVTYIAKYYGSMRSLKSAFGLSQSVEWNKESIWARLVEYSGSHPSFKQSDLNRENGLPSLPCILAHYPELKNFSGIKHALGSEPNYRFWTKEDVISAGKAYLKTHDGITLKDLRSENGLPTSKVIYGHFGDMRSFQEAIGSEIPQSRKFITKEEILSATKDTVAENGNVFKSRSAFLEKLPYSLSVIIYRFGSFDAFAKEADIKFTKTKKAKYEKAEVDDAILAYLKGGNAVPSAAKQLSSLGLPSASTILRFYDDWKEPFSVFAKMLDITGR